MAVGQSKCSLPGWFGEHSTHAPAAGGKSAAVCNGEGSVIPTHFRDIHQRRINGVSGACRARPEGRICGSVCVRGRSSRELLMRLR